MKRYVTIAGTLLGFVVLYLLAWPVPIQPLSWQAPVDRGLTDPFEADDRLQAAVGIKLGEFRGPEDATLGMDGKLYVTTEGGFILQIDGQRVQRFAFAGGRPLGIATAPDGSLIVANAYNGLQRISRSGSVSTLLDEVGGRALLYANNLAIASGGTIYFSESSSKFGAMSSDGTYEASLLDIMEHGGHGRVFALDPVSGKVAVLLEALNFANGIAVSADEQFLLVSETGSYRVLKHFLAGERRGETEVLLDNLPGFPDNLKSGAQGRFWLGLAAPRNAVLDRLSDKPWLRKMIQRLPAFLRPKAVPSSHVIAFNGDGKILMNLQDPDARFAMLTGVLETPQSLYLTTLFGHELPQLSKSLLR